MPQAVPERPERMPTAALPNRHSADQAASAADASAASGRPATDPVPDATQQALTPAELHRWAEHYAQHTSEAAQISTGSAHVIFRLGGERFAVPLDDLDEVARVEVGIGLSQARSLVLGLVNIRGEVVPMLDTGAALGARSTCRLGNANRTLVVRDARDRRTALPVDQIESVELLPAELFQLQPAAEDAALIRRIGIGEYGDGSLTLLDMSGLRRAETDTF